MNHGAGISDADGYPFFGHILSQQPLEVTTERVKICFSLSVLTGW